MTRTLLQLATLAALGMGAGAAAAQTGAGPAPGTVNSGNVAIESKRQLDARDELIERSERNKKDAVTAKRRKANVIVGATAGDLAVGKRVADLKGGVIGTIEAVEADGVVVFSGTERAKVPLDAFGISKGALVMPITRAEFDAAAAAAKAAQQG